MADAEYQEIAGSGLVRVTTHADVEAAVAKRESAQFQEEINQFWSNLQASGFSPTMVERVWVAARCQHMNASAISTMPLRHHGSRPPAWLSNPDPSWFPNGVADAIYAAIDSFYGWGDAFFYVTSRYADGYPSAFTVIDPSIITVEVRGGRRQYKANDRWLNAENMVQVSRNPRPGSVRGTSALRSAASYANGLLSASDLGNTMMASGGTPNAVIKSKRKLKPGQASQIQSDWMSATANRRGAPAVLPPDLDFETLQINPSDLLLLDVQKFDSQVIAACYGVPSSLANMPPEQGLNYTTPVLVMEQWWRSELNTTAYRFQQALSANMLPAGSWVEFDSARFLAPTFEEFATVVMNLAEKGILSVEEARATLFGFPSGVTGPEAVQELLTPPSAGASPVQQPSSSVIALRPTQAVS